MLASCTILPRKLYTFKQNDPVIKIPFSLMFQKTEILWTSSICSLDLEKAQKGQLAATSIIGYAKNKNCVFISR